MGFALDIQLEAKRIDQNSNQEDATFQVLAPSDQGPWDDSDLTRRIEWETEVKQALPSSNIGICGSEFALTSFIRSRRREQEGRRRMYVCARSTGFVISRARDLTGLAIDLLLRFTLSILS